MLYSHTAHTVYAITNLFVSAVLYDSYSMASSTHAGALGNGCHGMWFAFQAYQGPTDGHNAPKVLHGYQLPLFNAAESALQRPGPNHK